MTKTEVGGLSILADLERSGAITPVSLRIDDPDFPYERWEALGRYLGEIKSRSSFYLGDWLNFGEGIYPDRYSQATDATGLNYETLTNYASVCRKVARSRRRDQLSFGHHSEVSSLPASEQTHWLREAERNGWKRRELRDAIARARNGQVEEAVAVLPPAPLSPVAITTAAGSLVEVAETLGKLADGDLVPAGSIPKAVQAVQRASETLRAAATIPTLRELVEALVAEATPYDHEDGGQTYYLVPSETIDELRALVGEETHV